MLSVIILNVILQNVNRLNVMADFFLSIVFVNLYDDGLSASCIVDIEGGGGVFKERL
jgi:hypothetical protein